MWKPFSEEIKLQQKNLFFSVSMYFSCRGLGYLAGRQKILLFRLQMRTRPLHSVGFFCVQVVSFKMRRGRAFLVASGIAVGGHVGRCRRGAQRKVCDVWLVEAEL